jgi:Leucine-rich repeat (LRR) protein
LLSGNRIDDIVPLYRLSRLRELVLSNNSISDLRALMPLDRLVRLSLRNNDIEDIGPLIFNQGWGDGDLIDLRDNPLDQEDCSNIQTLIARGVAVTHDLDCSAVTG